MFKVIKSRSPSLAVPISWSSRDRICACADIAAATRHRKSKRKQKQREVLFNKTKPLNKMIIITVIVNNLHSVSALSGIDGAPLWTQLVPEEARFIQCGFETLGRGPGPACLLTGTRTLLRAVQADTGSSLWQLSPQALGGRIAGPALRVPDLNADSVPDLLVSVLPGDQVTLSGPSPGPVTLSSAGPSPGPVTLSSAGPSPGPVTLSSAGPSPGPVTLSSGSQFPAGRGDSHLSLLLVSGADGALIGSRVTFNLTRPDKPIGPQLHVTRGGAVYVLFGFALTSCRLTMSNELGGSDYGSQHASVPAALGSVLDLEAQPLFHRETILQLSLQTNPLLLTTGVEQNSADKMNCKPSDPAQPALLNSTVICASISIQSETVPLRLQHGAPILLNTTEHGAKMAATGVAVSYRLTTAPRPQRIVGYPPAPGRTPAGGPPL
ncbi:F234B protein, partial [Polyodon spathula]|nr:F234B protein [Polyodon spathula]